MPKTAMYTLFWSAERGTYEVRDQGDKDSYPLYKEDDDLFTQLIAGSSFAFQGQQGRLTLRKEFRQHGSKEGYWYAYRNQGRKTLKKYAGRSVSLTIERLEKIATEFNATTLTTQDDQEGETSPQVPSDTETADKFPPERVSTATYASLYEQQMLLLTPKLRLPRVHTPLVARERLLTQLDAGLTGKLTLLSAPAGFGKTTVISQWIAARSAHTETNQDTPSIAWLSLDTSENDPFRFWHYVVMACQRFADAIGQDSLSLLHTMQRSPSQASLLKTALTMFLNEISHLSGRNVLVLEDYHVITTQQIHEMMTFLLEHLPPTFHLILTTRESPPLPLSRLRAYNELNVLGATDLRFSQAETQEFLHQAIPFSLSAETRTHLETSMEGWVTGLRLAALTLQGRTTQQEVEHFLSTFSGNAQHIVEFFVSEVLSAQTKPMQFFLLQTSVLERLTGPLCDVVTERTDSEQVLEVVEQANLFLQPLDGSGQWYRYHTLFSEAMQREARRRLGEEILHTCYRRASGWYEQHGMLTEAVEAALKANDFEQAATQIERVAKPHYLSKMDEHHTLYRWLTTLPEEILGQHPKLCLRLVMIQQFPWDNWITRSAAYMDKLLDMAERYWQEHQNYSGLGEVYATRALVVGERGETALAADLARQALIWLPADEHQWQGACLRFVATEEFLSGKLLNAQRMFVNAATHFKAARNNFALRAILLTLSKVYVLQGELHLAAELYQEASLSSGKDFYDKGYAILGQAHLSYEWNTLEMAEQEAREVLSFSEQRTDDELYIQATFILIDIQQARGEKEQALHSLRTLLARLQQQKHQQLYREILVKQARLSLTGGDLAAVERWSTMRDHNGEAISRLQQEQEELLVARLLLAQGKGEQALHLLTFWLDDAHTNGRIRSELTILLLMARLHFAQGQRSEAHQSLKAALSLAHAEGYLRLFLDEGEEIAVLLRDILPTLQKEPLAIYTRKLLLAFTRPQFEQVASSPVTLPLIEPLSPQEQRVLRLLAAGHTKPEIAEILVVSTNTVKTQVRSIYRKLNVKSRKEVREVMRTQNLL